MAGFRTIDAHGIWRGEPAALDRFAKAYRVDCNGDDATWHRVYRWTPEALHAAKNAVADANLGREPTSREAAEEVRRILQEARA